MTTTTTAIANLIATARDDAQEWAGFPAGVLDHCDDPDDYVDAVGRASSHLYGDPSESYHAQQADKAAAAEVSDAGSIKEAILIATAYVTEVERARGEAAAAEYLSALDDVESALADGDVAEALESAERAARIERDYGGDDPATRELVEALEAAQVDDDEDDNEDDQ